MASEAGRGAQVRLDDTARQLARGGTGLRLVDNAATKAALEAAGLAPSGLTPDGSLPNGTAAEDEVLTPGGIISGGGGGGMPSFTGGAIVSVSGVFYLIAPGPYANDTAAEAGLVPIGGAYRHTSGAIIWRRV